MKPYLSAFAFLVICSNDTHAGLITLDFSGAVESAENVQLFPHNQGLQYIIPTTPFFVNPGDTIQAKLLFSNGSFDLLYDPLSPGVGTFGSVKEGTNTPPLTVQWGFSFSFLDSAGNPMLTGTSPRKAGGPDFYSGATILQTNDITVGGLFMEFSDIQIIEVGAAPIEITGVTFSFNNTILGLPFNGGINPNPVPEPSSAVIDGTELIGLVLLGRVRRYRKSRHLAAIA